MMQDKDISKACLDKFIGSTGTM